MVSNARISARLAAITPALVPALGQGRSVPSFKGGLFRRTRRCHAFIAVREFGISISASSIIATSSITTGSSLAPRAVLVVSVVVVVIAASPRSDSKGPNNCQHSYECCVLHLCIPTIFDGSTAVSRGLARTLAS